MIVVQQMPDRAWSRLYDDTTRSPPSVGPSTSRSRTYRVYHGSASYGVDSLSVMQNQLSPHLQVHDVFELKLKLVPVASTKIHTSSET